MTEAVLGLGSNRNFNGLTPVELLAKACAALTDILHEPVFSCVYRTGAMYVTDQDDFYNMAVLGTFDGTEHELLEAIHCVENTFGRDRSKEYRNGPRPLDIDIELFGDKTVNEADLVIPHERLKERAFVLKPMVQILRFSADDRNKERALKAAEWLSEYEPFLETVKNQKIELVSDIDFAEMLKK